MTFSTPPSDFSSNFDIVGCFVEYDGSVIILKRQLHKPQGGQYGLPAGKVDSGEDLTFAIIREVKEETGILLSPGELEFMQSFPTRYPGYDFMFHVYKAVLAEEPKVVINPSEHLHYRWVKPEEILSLPESMEDFDEYTKTIYNIST